MVKHLISHPLLLYAIENDLLRVDEIACRRHDTTILFKGSVTIDNTWLKLSRFLW